MNQSLRTIHFYGHMRKMTGVDSVQLVGDNMAVITAGLDSMFPGIKQHIRDNAWQVTFNDAPLEDSVGEDDIHELVKHNAKHVHIYPAVEGAGRTGQIIMGIVMIVIGVYSAFFTAGASSAQIVQGAGMILSGAMMVYTALVTPGAARERAAPDERTSFIFNGAVNTIEQGGAVPCVYGRTMIGSTVISAGINAEEMAYYSSPTGQTIAPNSAFGIQNQVLA